ncbi:endoplasmic reticulum metallopeptidase 1-like [Haliotis rufescens]|uniref:endoplasmic reticulum metallopeptidase 1-like n=1 Tax=Haliotis rufescens TaxID=6454 RepID=UPI00201F5844|nr:endoplasmic reticulum metallopeptidase 1-like [Haliotis rufescens]
MESNSNGNDSANLRKRHQHNNVNQHERNFSYEESKQRAKHGTSKIYLSGPLLILLSLLFYSSSVILVHVRMNSFPTPLLANNHSDQHFTEERARKHLDDITGFGPRVAGSYANIQAEKYIFSELNKINQVRNHVHDIQVDIQNVTGSFVLDFIGVGEFTSVYSNLRNVIAMLSPAEKIGDHSILINCHYDTVTDSPGASDDAVSCTLMLEILRALSQRRTPLMHNIIFLFNGAEENILQASHGFITQHRWADKIRAFVNLDSAGAGGWELVFQTGPEHPWLVRAYADSAKYPCGSAVCQEIFQSGLVPSDTDFRVFRDYGNLPGLDIAHVKNGYVYHTKYDRPDMVQPGCLQRGGENLQALLVTLATSKQVIDPGEDKHGNMVFFDFIGYFMISYPQRVGVLINWSIVAVVLLSIFRKITADSDSPGIVTYAVQISGAVISIMLTWVAVVTSAVTVALLLNMVGHEMSWYSNIHNISWLFILPGVTCGLGVNLFLKETVYRDWDPWRVETLFFEANLLFLSSILSVLTYHNIMSSYVILLWVMFPIIIRDRMSRLLSITFRDNHSAYYLMTFTSLFVPAFYTVYITYALIHFFIPIMGRLGRVVVPDIPVSVITAFPVLLAAGFQAGMVYPSKKIGRMVGILGLLSIAGFLLVVLTPLGFPYSTTNEQMSRQRTAVMHIDRQFHDQSMSVIRRDSSLWYIPFDYKGPRLLQKEVPELFAEAKPVLCEGAYCGRPYLYPVLPLFDAVDSLDLPAPRLNLTRRLSVTVTKRETIAPDRVKLYFSVTGPDHMNCYIMPRPDVRVIWWSMGSHDPQPVRTNDHVTEPTYFLYHAHGHESEDSWDFSVEFYVSQKKDKTDPIVDIGFGGHYLHGNNQKTEHSQRFASKLPGWTVYVGWSCTYDMYTL